jgi:hypothetical protein
VKMNKKNEGWEEDEEMKRKKKVLLTCGINI